MRILLINRFGHRIGGIEVHLRHLAAELIRRGHHAALLHEHPLPPGSEPIAPQGHPRWCLSGATHDSLLEAIRAWAPDVVYAHQLIDGGLLTRLQAEWPSVYFAHCYVGVCVSGGKCWKSPEPRVCQRTLGWGCLLHYYPHRCGGLNPWAMWRLFGQQRVALEQLKGFHRLVTHSEYVREEYLRHGFAAERVVRVPFWIPGLEQGKSPRLVPGEPARLLFLGRCELVKGGAFLLDALPMLATALGRNVELTLAGDGPERLRWQKRAKRAMAQHPGVRVSFPGWLGARARDSALARAHVIVIPSVWPEPFGMTGIEAGYHGVPSVAFDVGGIREWLEDGVNGHLAPASPPTPQALVEALQKTLAEEGHYQRLCEGALAATRRFHVEPHLAAIERLLESSRCIAPTLATAAG